ncbi:MAG: DNAJC11 domain-containing protein, partial [Terriglobales bacterium]
MKRSTTALLLLLLITLPMFAQAQGVGNRRELTRAEYGWGNNWVDVTDRIASLIRDNSLNFRVDNDTLGFDPVRGRDKTLRLYLRDKQGRTRMVTFAEDSNVRLRRIYSAYQSTDYYDRDLLILRGTYGYGNRAFDVTDRLQRQVRNDRLSLRVTNDTMGGDPAVGEDKTLTVQYSFNGRTNQAVVREG